MAEKRRNNKRGMTHKMGDLKTFRVNINCARTRIHFINIESKMFLVKHPESNISKVACMLGKLSLVQLSPEQMSAH